VSDPAGRGCQADAGIGQRLGAPPVTYSSQSSRTAGRRARAARLDIIYGDAVVVTDQREVGSTTIWRDRTDRTDILVAVHAVAKDYSSGRPSAAPPRAKGPRPLDRGSRHPPRITALVARSAVSITLAHRVCMVVRQIHPATQSVTERLEEGRRSVRWAKALKSSGYTIMRCHGRWHEWRRTADGQLPFILPALSIIV